MLRRAFCATCIGVDAITVTVEVDVSPGISFFLVGLPDSAVRESQQRIGTALHTVGAKLPGKKIVINMVVIGLVHLIKRILTHFVHPLILHNFDLKKYIYHITYLYK